MQQLLKDWVGSRGDSDSRGAGAIGLYCCPACHALLACVGLNWPVWLQQRLSFTPHVVHSNCQGRYAVTIHRF